MLVNRAPQSICPGDRITDNGIRYVAVSNHPIEDVGPATHKRLADGGWSGLLRVRRPHGKHIKTYYYTATGRFEFMYSN
jgi:hypothetical protein